MAVAESFVDIPAGRPHLHDGGQPLHALHRTGEEFNREISDLEELLSKLNPMAEEFVPPSLAGQQPVGYPGAGAYSDGHGAFVNGGALGGGFEINGIGGRRKKNGYSQGKRRMNRRTNLAQREDVIRRTVYVSDIDQQADSATAALNCSGVVLGSLPIRVSPSKTPVRPRACRSPVH